MSSSPGRSFAVDSTMSSQDLVSKLKQNLVHVDIAREYVDHKRDMITFCLENSYTRADLIEV